MRKTVDDAEFGVVSNPNAWTPGRYDTLGPVGRAILPLHVGRSLPPVVALACYFDESFDQQIHVVGGYLAEVDLWDRVFVPAWNKALRNAPHPISEFKASDCETGRREFAQPWTEEQRYQLMDEMISVILNVPLCAGVSAAFVWPGNPDPGSRKAKKWRRQTAQLGYAESVGVCLGQAVWLGGQLSDTDSIQPVLDEREGFSEAVALSFANVRQFIGPELAAKVMFPISRGSKELVPLQAADLIAYETFKEVKARFDNIKPRRQLVRLVSGNTPYISRCLAMPDIPWWNLLRAMGKRPMPTEHTLFKRGVPLRAPGHWGVP